MIEKTETVEVAPEVSVDDAIRHLTGIVNILLVGQEPMGNATIPTAARTNLQDAIGSLSIFIANEVEKLAE